jgi:glycerol-3-phosphate acyltransferase PlsY
VGLWIVVILLTGYVGLATMIAAIAFVGIVLWLATPEQWPTLLPFAVCGTSLILFAHRPNIRRLFDGTESRFDSVRIFHRRQ